MSPQDFDDLAAVEATHWWFAGMRRITAELLAAQVPTRTPRLVLDAGCGTGYMLRWLERYTNGHAPHGTDFTLAALRHCQAQAWSRLTQASVTHLPYADEAFDLITCFDVLQQLRHPEDDGRALRELARLLRPGGMLFVRAAAYRWMWSKHDTHMHTQHRYTLRELRDLLTAAGLRVRRSTYSLCLLFPVAALYRLMKAFARHTPPSDVRPVGPQWLNGWLRTILSWEAALLRRGCSLPFGLSIVCVAQKRGGE